MDIKPILGSAVGFGATKLAVDSGKMVNDSLKGHVKSNSLVKGTVNLMVGSSLLGATSKMINEL